MFWGTVFGVVYLLGGILLAVFARKIAVWDYAYDLKWKIIVNLSLGFRIWVLRMGGILLALVGLFALLPYLSLL